VKKSVLAHIILYFIKMVFYHIISWKILDGNPMNSFEVGSYLMIDDENVEINMLPYE
jgi:hypothetical protein